MKSEECVEVVERGVRRAGLKDRVQDMMLLIERNPARIVSRRQVKIKRERYVSVSAHQHKGVKYSTSQEGRFVFHGGCD